MADRQSYLDGAPATTWPHSVPVDRIRERSRRVLLDQTLLALRWVTILTLLAVTLYWPMPARSPFETWHLVALFALYSLVAQVAVGGVAPRTRSTVIACLDIAVVGGLYALGGALNGPLIALAVLSAAMTSVFMSAPATIAYTAALGLSITAAAVTLPGWTGSQPDIQFLGGQLIILAIAGVGMRLLTARAESERSQASHAAIRAARIAERDQTRSDFIATVSHDLRTPLTAARAGLALLGDSASTRLLPAESELLATSRRNVDRLGRLIDDLLTMNQLEAGTFRLDVEELDLRDVLHSAIAAIQPLMTQRDQRLEASLPAPLVLAGDRRRLEQVFLNLLSNAQRHSGPGSTIRIEAMSGPDGVAVRVADNGPGLPDPDIGRMFTPGARSDIPRGPGLGLVIVERMVRLHGGWVAASPVSTGGLAVTVALPPVRPAPGRAA